MKGVVNVEGLNQGETFHVENYCQQLKALPKDLKKNHLSLANRKCVLL